MYLKTKLYFVLTTTFLTSMRGKNETFFALVLVFDQPKLIPLNLRKCSNVLHHPTTPQVNPLLSKRGK